MKRILITLVLLFITTLGFSQLKLNMFREYYPYHDDKDDVIATIVSNNPNIDIDNIQVLTYVYKMHTTYYMYVFSDKNGYLLDIIMLGLEKNSRYELIINRDTYYHSDTFRGKHPNFYYDRKRNVTNISVIPKHGYKILMDDSTYVTYQFDLDRIVYKIEDHLTKDKYKWRYELK